MLAPLRREQRQVRYSITNAHRHRLGAMDHHRPITIVVDVEAHAQQAARHGDTPVAAGHRLNDAAATLHVGSSCLGHLARALNCHRRLLSRVPLEQLVVGPTARHERDAPRQVARIQHTGVEAQRPHRRDEVCGITHQEDATLLPRLRHPMVHRVDVGTQNAHVTDVADEASGPVGHLLTRGFLGACGKRKQEPPAVRLAHQDHPFGRIAEVCEVRVIALVLDIEVDL